jgi:hypothetical protein
MTNYRKVWDSRSAGPPHRAGAGGVDVRERPVAYVGSAREVAACLASWARLIELEPDEVFTDETVRTAGQHLTHLIEERMLGSARAPGDRLGAPGAPAGAPAPDR